MTVFGPAGESKVWRLSVALSLAFHFLVLAAIVAWGVSEVLNVAVSAPPARSSELEYAGVILSARGGAGTDPVESIIESIPGRLQEAGKMTPARRAAVINKGTKGLSTVRESSMFEIADLFAAEDRAYEPVLPPPAGAFDVDSQIPYDLRETEGGGCVMVLLDKAGRTYEVTFSKEEVTVDLRAAGQIFKMMKNMPGLRKVYMRMVVKMLPQFTKGETHGSNDDK